MFTTEQLRTELQADAQALGYGTVAGPDDDVRVANLLNAKSFSGPVSRMITARALIMAFYAADPTLGAARTFLAKIRDAAAVDPIMEVVWAFLKQDAGIDAGAVVALVQGLVPALFTAEEAGVVVSLAIKPLSRAEILWGAGTHISPADVSLTR